MRYVTSITLSVALGALALSSCQSDRLPSEPAVAPSAMVGAASQQTVSGSYYTTTPYWWDRFWWKEGDVEMFKGFGSPIIFAGDIVGEGSFTSNLAYKHHYAEDGSDTFTGALAGTITLTVSEFLGEPVTGTLEGITHSHINESYVHDEKIVLHGAGDLEGYKVLLDEQDYPAWPPVNTYTGTVFGPAVH